MVRCRHSSSTASRSPFPPGQCHQLKEPGPVFPVIASRCAHWRGNPFPLQRHDFLHVTKEKTDCHVASLLAMTVVDGTLALKLMTLPRGEGAPVRTLGRMRNGDMFHICMHFVKKVHWKSLYRLNKLHCKW